MIGIAVFFFSPYLIAAFGGDQKAIEYGIAEAHTIALFYCLLAFSHCMAAIQRGGKKYCSDVCYDDCMVRSPGNLY